MINFLHTFNPTPILISFGPINIYWYGMFIVTGILVALLIILKLADYYRIDKGVIIDSAFYLIIGGIIGARLFHVLLEFNYYLEHPLSIFMVWQGGLAIHGAIITGLGLAWYLARKNGVNFWLFAAIFLPGLAIAQAIGRWGNYFNQELFGRPTNLPWGIPIQPANRILEYYNFTYFHPTFLYESLGNMIIFITLLVFHYLIIKKIICQKNSPVTCYVLSVMYYLTMYSALRFSLEFVRTDQTPIIFGLRFPQITSLVIIAAALLVYIYLKRTKPLLDKLNNL